MNFQNRFFIFLIQNSYNNNKYHLNSISELYSNSNWLEREISELNAVFFFNKKDLRNLMLPYGDTSAPFLKNFPSVGTKEIYYDSLIDNLSQNNLTIQF